MRCAPIYLNKTNETSPCLTKNTVPFLQRDTVFFNLQTSRAAKCFFFFVKLHCKGIIICVKNNSVSH